MNRIALVVLLSTLALTATAASSRPTVAAEPDYPGGKFCYTVIGLYNASKTGDPADHEKIVAAIQQAMNHTATDPIAVVDIERCLQS